MSQIEQADPNRWWQAFVDNMSPVIKRVVAFSRKLPGISYYLFIFCCFFLTYAFNIVVSQRPSVLLLNFLYTIQTLILQMAERHPFKISGWVLGLARKVD